MNNKSSVIVVGLDYSDHSDAALARGFELAASAWAAELHVLRVLPPREVARSSVPKGVLLETEVAAVQLRRYVASRWAEFSRGQEARAQPPSRLVSHIRFDHAANGIVQLASDLSADLIIVGTHGRRGFARFLLGSVSERVLRLAACPVLVMRPKAVIADDPVLEAPCPRCREEREQSSSELWCEEHRTKHGRSHTAVDLTE